MIVCRDFTLGNTVASTMPALASSRKQSPGESSRALSVCPGRAVPECGGEQGKRKDDMMLLNAKGNTLAAVDQ